MDRIYSETSEENDFTDRTIKRRISSILKAPRTPLRDLGNGNELTSDVNVEKRQRNSRRVSFADTVRVFLPDPKTTVVEDNAVLESTAEARDQNPLNRNEELQAVQCKITGMNTLLHAPIQKPLQQTEVNNSTQCHDATTGQEWNKMDRTHVFSEENEMDMTAGHTVTITHDIGVSRKIDFKTFSAELKSNKEVSKINEFSFFSSPTKMNDTCLPQQKINTEEPQKINIDDFLKSLRSTKLFPTPTAEEPFVSSEASARNVFFSEEHAYFCSQGEKCNMTTDFGGLDSRTDVEYCIPNEKAIVPPIWHPLKQFGCGEVTVVCRDESMDMTSANTESFLPPGTNSLNKVCQQENLGNIYPITYKTDSCRLKNSGYQLGVQQDPSICILNNKAFEEKTIDLNRSQVAKSDRKQPESQFLPLSGDMTVFALLNCTTVDSKTNGNSRMSGNAISADKTVAFECNEDMEITKPTTYLLDKSLNAAGFQDEPQREMKGGKKSVSGLNSDKTVIFSLSGDNEMEITRSCTVAVNHDIALQCEQVPQALSLQSVNETIYPYHSDMEETKLSACIIDQSLKNVDVQTLQKLGNESSDKTVTGSTKDKTLVFSCSDDNEMEITRSLTGAINHDVPQCEDIPNTSFVPSNKTVMFTFSEDMEITKPVTYANDVSLKSKTGCLAVPQQSAGTVKQRLMRLASDNTIAFPVTEVNEMEITKSLTVAVEGALQTLSPVPAKKTNMFVHGSNTVLSKPTISIPVDKTLTFMHNNDMEITKPIMNISNISLKNTDFKVLPQKEKETGKVILPESTREETALFLLREDNEMEITKCHTVTVNHDDVQQAKVATQGLSSNTADKTSVSICSSGTTVTTSLPSVPADKTVMFVHNNEMDITKPISNVLLESPVFRALLHKGKETSKTTLPGAVKDYTNCLMLPENEMEITKSNTVVVNHDIVCQCVKTQVPFGWGVIGIARPHTVARENMHKNAETPGKHAEGEPASDQMSEARADMKTTNSHSVPFESETVLCGLSRRQDECIFLLNKTHRDGTGVTNLPPLTVDNGSLEGSEKQDMPSKNLDQMPSPTCEKTQDLEITRNQTVTISGATNYVSAAEKWIPNSFTKSSEKSFAFSDGENMEMTRNYTTGIMHANDFEDECYLLSQAKPGSEFSASLIPYEKKLDIDKSMLQNSTCSPNERLCVPLNIFQQQRNSLKIQESQLESCTQKTNNPVKEIMSSDVYCRKENDLVLLDEMQAANPKLREETALDLNTERMCTLVSNYENLKNDPKKLLPSRQKSNHTGGTEDLAADDRVPKNHEAVLYQYSSITKDWQTNLGFLSEEEPIRLSQLSGIVNDDSRLKDVGKKSEHILLSQNVRASLGEQLPKLMMKQKDILGLRDNIEEFNNPIASNELTNMNITEGEVLSVPTNTKGKDHCQITKLPLGIFPPKLPNWRKSAVSNIEDICARSKERTNAQDSEISLIIKKPSEKIIQNSSPSHYITEELFPGSAEETDSNESLSFEVLEKPCNVMNEKENIDNEGHIFEVFETNDRQKRARNQDDDELQKEKKLKIDEGWKDTAELNQPLSSTMVAHSHAEAHEGINVPDLIVTNLERTQNSNSSSLDSLKADTDFSIQQNGKMETPLLVDNICEQNLQEKLQEGVITVREFFTLLQVHVVIQKPRRSQLPPKYAISTVPTPEDAILSQYIYHPKLQAYDEDCQILSQTIEELQLRVYDQDKLLVNVHKSLWEVMTTCCDEELKGFGAELNKMKSCFAKKSKVLAHRGKAKLYAKLVQTAQVQWEKLQSRLAEVDELLREIDSCLVALETETAELEKSALDVNDTTAEYVSKLKDAESELEYHKTQEESLQREQSNLRVQKQERISEINHLQEDAKNCQELLKKYNFSEWVMKEWNDHHVVFAFLYDSIELTVALGCPVDDTAFSNKFCRKIVGLKFESLLDEAKALPSCKLVQRLIFQFIESQRSWQEKCLTLHHLYEMLYDISLVVSRCRLLGEEIEFLDRWGGKFNLVKTELHDTKLKLLFSSSIAFAKFEVELSLSASYPASPMAFTVQKCIGNIGQEEISEVLSSVPVGANYLRRVVNEIYHNLLQRPPTVHKHQSQPSSCQMGHVASETLVKI